MRRRFPFKLFTWKTGLLSALLFIVAFNGIAWMQARAMTHYLVDGGIVRRQKPEDLSVTEKAWIVLTGVRVTRPENERTPESVGLPYETHRIDFDRGQDFDREQDREEYLEAWFTPAENSKGIVLLFPQYGGSKEGVLSPAQAFHSLGYDIFLVDFRGAGGSSGSTTTMGVREGADVAQAVSYVRQTWSDRPLVLYGASLGSVSVMRAIAHEGVEPDATILESPFDSLLKTVRHRFTASGLPAFPSAEVLVFWGGLQQNINGFAHNPADYAAEMHGPVLLMHGEADTRVKVEEAEAIFERLPGQKTLVFFPSVGHGAFAREYPAEWAQTVDQFLQQSLESHETTSKDI